MRKPKCKVCNVVNVAVWDRSDKYKTGWCRGCFSKIFQRVPQEKDDRPRIIKGYQGIKEYKNYDV